MPPSLIPFAEMRAHLLERYRNAVVARSLAVGRSDLRLRGRPIRDTGCPGPEAGCHEGYQLIRPAVAMDFLMYVDSLSPTVGELPSV